MPIKSIKNENKEFFAWNLKEKHREEDFICPICKESLIPVIPNKNIIKHFRHENEESHGEKETRAHIIGKKSVFTFLKKRGLNPKLEERIDEKIADIIIPNESQLIEIQCSKISSNEINSRVKNAEMNGYSITWVFGGEYYDNTQDYKVFQKNNGDSYKYQNITKAERKVGITKIKNAVNPFKRSIFEGYSKLLHIDDKGSIYEAEFEPKWKTGGGRCKTKGWYSLEKIYGKEKEEKLLNKSI